VFKSRWLEYFASLGEPRPATGTGKGGLKVTLETIEAPELQIFRGKQVFAGGNLEVLRVTAGAPEFVFDIHGAVDYEATSARGSLVLTVHQEPRIQGTASLLGVALTALTGDAAMPPLLLDGDTTFAMAQDASVTVEARGRVRLPKQADALGPFEVTVRRDADALRLDNLKVHTAPLSLEGALEVFDDRRWNLSLEEATLRNQGIDWLVARVPGIPVVSQAGAASEGVLRKVRLGGDQTEGFSFAEGTIVVSEVGLRLNGGYQIDDIHGAISVQNDSYQLSDFTNGPLDASGTMNINYETDTVDLDLIGRLKLGSDFPLPEPLASALRPEGGLVTMPVFRATFVQGKVQLPTLHIAASLEAGVIAFFDKTRNVFAPATDIEGEATFSEGALRVTRLKGPHSEFTGTLTPDDTLDRWTVSSSFTSDLASPLWEFIQPPAVTLQGGALTCTRLDGVFVRGQKVPESLALEASVKGAEIAIADGGFNDALRLDSVTFSSTSTEVTYDAAGTSGLLGPFTARGTYALATGAVDTQARLRLNEAKSLPESWRAGIAGTVLRAMGEVPLHLQYAGKDRGLELSSDAPLDMNGTLKFATGGRAPFALDLSAHLPAAWLAPHFSPDLEPSGAVLVTATVSSGDGALTVRADFSDTDLGWSLFRKKAGFPLALTASGEWKGGSARMSGGRVEVAGEQLPFTLKDGLPRADQIALSLEPLSPLLPDGGTLGGRISGSYGGAGGALVLNFHGVHAQIAPDLLPMSLDGPLTRKGEEWRVENLIWSLGASQGSLQATGSGELWQGRVQASQIHASELRQGYQAWNARRGLPEDDDAMPWNFSGDFDVTSESLVWAEAVLQPVRGIAHFSPGAVQIADLSLGHGSGQITGGMGYVSAREGNPATLTTNLAVVGVDAVLLEGLFLEKARGLAGLMNGGVNLTIPLPPGSPSLMNTMSGEIQFEAENGTLGKAGLASKLLAALKTTDILRLRIPQLKDRGLAFRTLSGRVLIDQGVFRVDPFTLSDPAYVLVTRATFDYPNDKAEGGGEIQVLEGVTGMARKIPILGDAANLVSKVFGVPIKVSGTAKDPAFGVGVAAPAKTNKEP
jgi:hypothetical protein